jgi:hypothetical protein
MRYEFDKAWPFMRAGALLIFDDVGGNSAFVDFVTSRRIERRFSAPKADEAGLFGVAFKP